MITRFGMSEKFGMMSLVTVESQYLDGRASMNCAEETAAEVDKEVLKVINSCYAEAVRLLTENREVLDKIADYLYEHETITGKEFMKIFRELKGLPEEDEKEQKNNDTKADAKEDTQAEDQQTKQQDEQSGVTLEKGQHIDMTADDNHAKE